MIKSVWARGWLAIWAGIVLYAFVVLTGRALEIGNGTATDAFSEANALRAANAFLVEGFGPSYGLQRTGYGLLYPGQGHAGHPDSYVYTHYPPGPEFLLTLYQKVFGELNVPLFRIIHIYIFIAASVFLSQALVPLLGIARTCILTALMGCVPATYLMAHGLHYQGLALSMLLAQLGAIVRVCTAPHCSRGSLLLIGTFGFIQGWLSFDYFFLTALIAIPAYLIFSPTAGRLATRLPFKMCVAATLGFVAAHAIHFAQNILYFRGVSAAIDDMFFAARTRSFTDIRPSYWSALSVTVERYLTKLPFNSDYLALSAYGVCAVVALVCFFPVRTLTIRRKTFCISWRVRFGLLAAIAVAYLWIVVMPAHAWIHAHFIPRHLTVLPLLAFAAILCVTRPLATEVGTTEQEQLIQRRMSLMYALPIVVLMVHSQSLLPKNWASYHHAGFTVRSAEQPWNRWRFDRDTDNRPLSIAGVIYNHGIGTHPHSRIRISPPRGAATIAGGCGVQDGWRNGTVRCHIYQGETLLWSSATLRHGVPAQRFTVSLNPGLDVVLVIDDGGDQYNADISNWVDLHFGG